MQTAGRGHRGLLLSSVKLLVAFSGYSGQNKLIRPDGSVSTLSLPPGNTGDPGGLCFSPDNSNLFMVHSKNNTGNKQATLYNVLTAEVITRLPQYTTNDSGKYPQYSPDGQYVAISCYTGTPALVVFKTSDWSMVTLPETPTHCEMTKWAPDSSALLCATGDAPYLWIYNVGETWTRRAVAFGTGTTPVGFVSGIGMSPNGENFILGVPNTSPKWASYQYPSLNIMPHLTPSPPHIWSPGGIRIEFNAAASMVAITCESGDKFYVYDMATRARKTLPTELTATHVMDVAFAKKGNLMATTVYGDAPYARVYNAATMTQIPLPITLTNGVRNVAMG